MVAVPIERILKPGKQEKWKERMPVVAYLGLECDAMLEGLLRMKRYPGVVVVVLYEIVVLLGGHGDDGDG